VSVDTLEVTGFLHLTSSTWATALVYWNSWLKVVFLLQRSGLLQNALY